MLRKYSSDIALLIGFIMLLSMLPPARAANSGYVVPPYSDMSLSSRNNTCTTTWDSNFFPKGYYCVAGQASKGLADTGENADPTGPDTVTSYSGSVLFDQNQNDGVPLSSGGTISMATDMKLSGIVSANYACTIQPPSCSADAALNVVWSYIWYNSGCPCYQTVTFTGNLWDVNKQNGGTSYSCANCQYVLAIKNAPAKWVGGGISTSAWADSGYSAYSYFTSQDPQGLFGTSYYAYITEIQAASWSISLTASDTSPAVGQSVTLSASTSTDVSSWSYFINIFDQTSGTLVGVCSSGTLCSASVSQSSATTHTYMACVGNFGSCSSSSAVVTSSTVSVTWGSSGGSGGLKISISQSGTTLTWSISGLTPSGSFTVSETTSQGFNDGFGPYTASSTGTDSRSFNYGGGTAGDVVTLTVTDSTTTGTATTSYTVQSSSPSLSISITQSGSALTWHISGLTPSGSFMVHETTSQGFTDDFQYTASSSGTDSRSFNYGGGTSGDVITLTVTDVTTGKQATTQYTLK